VPFVHGVAARQRRSAPANTAVCRLAGPCCHHKESPEPAGGVQGPTRPSISSIVNCLGFVAGVLVLWGPQGDFPVFLAVAVLVLTVLLSVTTVRSRRQARL
jgi:hypothetical protein